MANTTNFNWETPDDTDLVKDGAAAIRTLGSSIDTSFVDLKGGTTGQILSKASNTDLDYTWIANDQGDITEVQAGTGISVASGTGPIPVVTNTVATTFDAKGDLVVGTGADTFAKLTVGTNGYTLVADSAETTGLKWAAPAAGSETLLSTTSASGTSTTISSISGAYKHLRIWIYDIDITTATSAQLRFRFNGDTAANYPNAYYSNAASILADNTVGYLTADRPHSVTASETSIILDVYHYSNTDAYKPFQAAGIYLDHTASAYYATHCVGGYASTSAIDSFTILTANPQSFTATVKIYGVN